VHDRPLEYVRRVVCRCGDCAAKRDALIIGAMSENQVSFGRYVLDMGRGCMLSDGREIPLRSQTFAVLAYLAQRPGQIVSQEELFEAGWPGLIVSSETLDQSITELRRALDDADATLLSTLPEQGGYRLDPDAAPPERRHQPGLQKAFRWRWMYGLIAPLALFAAFVAIWFVTSREGEPESADTQHPAVAILPFHDQGEDAAREYFADGLSQDLIEALGRFPELTVMSWNAVSIYKGAVAQPGEIARVLDVRYQVEGSLRQDADRVRISAQLVDVQGRVMWSGRYDEPVADLFALQDRITAEIAGALGVSDTGLERRSTSVGFTNLDAYDLVLRARPHLRRPTRAGLAEAQSLLRQAVALDPHYAEAHAELGETFHAAASEGLADPPLDTWQRVTAHANDALRADANNVRARVLLGRMHLAFNRYTEAGIEMERAIRANPNDADALAGQGNVWLWSGRVKQAIESLMLAQRLDPELDTYDRFALGLAYFLDGQYAAAIEQAELNLRRTPEASINLAVLAASHAQSDNHAEAGRAAEEFRRRDPELRTLLFGTKFQDTRDLERLRRGLEKAGISPR